jgi:hypothetical protein
MSNEHEEQDGQASSRDGDDDVEAQDEDRKEDRKGQAKQDLAQRPQDRSVNRGTKQEENVRSIYYYLEWLSLGRLEFSCFSKT